MTVADTILEKVRSMPPDKQEQVLAYVVRMGQQPAPKRPLFNPEGLAAGIDDDPALEVFQRNRREMWGSATDRELQ